jgi:hypothetical protein
MRQFLIQFCVLCFIVGCAKKSVPFSTNGIFTIDMPCKISQTQGLDSEMGTINCDSVIFKYDYGKYGNPGPLNDVEQFKLAFRGKYHSVFFEKIHIDSKLYRLYMDSVQVVDVTALKDHNKTLLFDCSVCNRVATLKFRKAIYRFPFFTDQNLSGSTHIFYLDTIGEYHRKIYLSQNGGVSGLYLSPLENAKQGNKLSIQTTTNSSVEYLLKILQSVRLVQTKSKEK